MKRNAAASSAPIFGFNRARESIVDEVTRRVCERATDPLLLLSDAAYHEIKRLSAAGGGAAALAKWRTLSRSLGRLRPAEQKERLEEIVRGHAWDVAGNFDPRVFAVATRLMPPLLSALLNPSSLATPHGLLHLLDAEAIANRIVISGPVEQVQRLTRVGTVVYVPTHLSNMDSIVFGFALEQSGLPPATYGAGVNLFSNPLLSFFMHNLGAYRVDRRLRHTLYKDVLKTYSCVLIERGYHSLFFPGGTRSRSGCVERHLKLGLAGTGVEAFARTAKAGRPRRVFFVPATINYLLTLEAETLVDDFLSEEGKARYIIEDDESTRVGRTVSFMKKLVGHEAAVAIRFGDPVDPFGNRVDEEGRSHDARGREVDPVSYVKDRHGQVTVDPARDAQYTRELADAICAAYAKDTVVMPTHIVAAAAFGRLVAAHPGPDLFALLRHRDDLLVRREELASDVEKLRDRAEALEREGRIVLAPTVKAATGNQMIDAALRAFDGYHTAPVLTAYADGLSLSDTRLLLYYQNRLAAHGLAYDPMAPRPAARGKAASS